MPVTEPVKARDIVLLAKRSGGGGSQSLGHIRPRAQVRAQSQPRGDGAQRLSGDGVGEARRQLGQRDGQMGPGEQIGVGQPQLGRFDDQGSEKAQVEVDDPRRVLVDRTEAAQLSLDPPQLLADLGRVLFSLDQRSCD